MRTMKIVKQTGELKPSEAIAKYGNKFNVARHVGETLREVEPQRLVDTVKIINTKFGGGEISTEQAGQIALDLVNSKGYMNLTELKLAVSSSISGEVSGLDKEDLKPYGPISWRFLATIINAYQEWVSKFIKPVYEEPKKKERSPEQKKADRANFINEVLKNVIEDTLHPKRSIYTKTEKRSFYGLVFGFLEKEGIQVATTEQKKETLNDLRRTEIGKPGKYYQNGQKNEFKRFCEPTFMERPNKEKKRNPIYCAIIGDAKEILLTDFIRECDLVERDIVKELLDR